MVLITCPFCSGKISDFSRDCPHCGGPSWAFDPYGATPGVPFPLNIGDRFVMGEWGEGEGREPIIWRVLDVQTGRILVISEYGLDCRQFNSRREKGNGWQSSDLKAWLENTFLPGAFPPEERASIAEVTCLSAEEAESLFEDNHDRICRPTEYAVQRGAYKNDCMGGCWWWLRSPGTNGSGYAASVYGSGGVVSFGYSVDRSDFAVRPALWLNL